MRGSAVRARGAAAPASPSTRPGGGTWRTALVCAVAACGSVGVVASVATPAAAATVRPSALKGVWGPTAGADAARYLDQAVGLGAQRYYTTLRWSDLSTGRPAHPGDPQDPTLHWPASMDDALAAARARGIRVVVNVTTAPAWASGAGDAITPPRDPRTFAAFVAAASKRYPGVVGWQIWSEPTKPQNWSGLPTPASPTAPLNAAERRAPVLYARMLDASYAALRRVDPGDLVIGGNTWTAGQISPLQWIRAMRLPDGSPPRMSVYGHNPFSARGARTADGPLVPGYADISDTDDLLTWLDRWQRRGGRRLPVLFSEFTIPTDRPSSEFNFYVPRATQSRWTTAALRLVRRERRLAGIAWVGLFDTPAGDGGEHTTGLLDAAGVPKPAYAAFAKG